MVICRTNATDIVESAAISLVKRGARGVVVNTTKYGIDKEERQNVTDVGRATYR